MKPINRRRTLDEIIRFTSSVGENTIFTGTIDTPESIVVRGTVIGDSNIEGIVVIKKNGKWLGNITVRTIIINGYVEGDITAFEKIEIQKNAKLIGSLSCPKIAIECGAINEGRIHMEDKTQIITFKEKRQE